MIAPPDAPPKVGCAACGHVFSRASACLVCHRAKCQCKPKLPTYPVKLQPTASPQFWRGYCPNCGGPGPLMTDFRAAMQNARARSLAGMRKRHMSGHRGRAVLTCEYCQRGNPPGQLLIGEIAK